MCSPEQNNGPQPSALRCVLLIWSQCLESVEALDPFLAEVDLAPVLGHNSKKSYRGAKQYRGNSSLLF
jgi:hypothetical protein